MQVELDKYDLICLLIGTGEPPTSVLVDLEQMRCGIYVGGMVDAWQWNREGVARWPSDTLWRLYKRIKAEQNVDYSDIREHLDKQDGDAECSGNGGRGDTNAG